MLENQKHNPISKPKEIGSFSLMSSIADLVTTLTEKQVQEAAGPDGMVRFTREASPEIIPADRVGQHKHTIWLQMTTVGKRIDMFNEDTPLGGMKSFLYKNGRVDRSCEIEQFVAAGTNSVKTENRTVGSILAVAKNRFREKDKVSQVTKLYKGDTILVHFTDDSREYSVLVHDNSKMIGETATVMCRVNYKRVGEKKIGGKMRMISREVTKEVVIRLPLKIWEKLTATAFEDGEIKKVMRRQIASIQLRRLGKELRGAH